MHMEHAAVLLESVRREARASRDYRLSLFDLQTACYQVLQRVLVHLGRPNEALLVAERSRTRAFVELLLERQGAATSQAESTSRNPHHSAQPASHSRVALFDDSLPTTMHHIEDIVNKQKACVLYFSIAAGFLYYWLIVPNHGVVAFHQRAISNCSHDSEGSAEHLPNANPGLPDMSTGVLDQYIQGIRDALGVQLHTCDTRCDTEGGDELADVWSQHLEELGDKLNQEGDRSGFLRMVNRSHAFNSSSYSLSSLFSLGSVSINSGTTTATSTSRPGSTHSRRSLWQGPACLRYMHTLLTFN